MSSTELEVFRALREKLGSLRSQLMEVEARSSNELSTVHPEYRESAINLLQYVAARHVDLRPIQLDLWRLGLSSLGRIEGHVRHALDQVIARLDDGLARAGVNVPPVASADAQALTSDEAERRLHRHTRDLFGPKPSDRHVCIMVTAPDATVVDESWVAQLLHAGMNVLRVNAAHEDAAEWAHIVGTARRVAASRGAELRVLVDLPGPKLRTLTVCPGPRVLHWKPQRDVFGRVTEPCRVTVRPERSDTAPLDGPWLDVPGEVWSHLQPLDELEFCDARGKRRRMTITERSDREAIATLNQTTYVVPETVIHVRRGAALLCDFRAQPIAARPMRLTLGFGDRFRLEAEPFGVQSSADQLPIMGCSSSEAVAAMRPGERVLFDDGKLECKVETQDARGVVLQVTHPKTGMFHLGAEKGINLPNATLGGPTLGPDDERALAFAVANADMVGASFVRNPDDVRTLYRRLDELGAQRLGVVLKIETVSAFARLPAILLAAMTRYPVGVMIARGDLAVEAGFERLAELQEEILWLCESAHVPVIWATQVLDQMARTGTATRAEVTDAAMSVRAECVMLNKGPCVTEALTALVDILRRMENHQYKKRSLYRKLGLEMPPFRAGAPSVVASG
jgi:pyruvate kinase